MGVHYGFGTINPADLSVDTDRTPITVATVFYAKGGLDGWASKGLRIYPKAAGGLNLSNCWAYLIELSTTGTYKLKRAKAFPTGLVVDTWNEILWDEPFGPLKEFPGPGQRMYAVAVYMPNGGYAFDPNKFQTVDHYSPTNADLVAPNSGDSGANGGAAGNGMFSPGALGNPALGPSMALSSWQAFNYTWYGVIEAVVADPAEGVPVKGYVFDADNFGAGSYSHDTDTNPVIAASRFHVAGSSRSDWKAFGVRVYVKPGAAQPMTGSWAYLYRIPGADAAGTPTLLAAKALPSPLTKGAWSEVLFDTPVDINEAPGGDYYVAAVYFPQGGFPNRSEALGTEILATDMPGLVCTDSGEGGNGLFKYGLQGNPAVPVLSGTGLFEPSSTSSHFGVDLIAGYGAGAAPVVPPANTVAPAVSGIAVTGQTLSCSTGSWDGAVSFAYQWQRNGVAISGATATTYVLQVADVAQAVRCQVTATNTAGSTPANSNAVTPTAPLPAGKLTIAEENALPAGITAPEFAFGGAGDPLNQGFCREFSLNVGETAHFAVHGDCQSIWILRCGYYNGIGFRKVTTVVNTPTSQPNPATIPNSNGSTTCSGWTNTASWAIPANATPGMYMALVKNAALNNGSFIPFVVRDDGRPAQVMVKSSDATWALAYNYFATPASPFTGKSFYGGSGPMSGGMDNRGFCMSYHRPIVTRQGIVQTYPMYDEFPLIRFLERNGVDVTYSSCKDWRSGGPTLAACDVYVSNGHDEYWSQAMRDKWEALRDAGKHLLFFGGNIVFWRTREADNGDTLWCHKDTMAGPPGHTAGTALDPVSWTGTWKDTRAANNATRDPEWTLTGGDFRMNGILYRTVVVPAGSPESGTPFWRGTTVPASGLSAEDLIGMEGDELRLQVPALNRKVLATTTVNIDGARADDNGENYSGNGSLIWGIGFQRYPGGAAVVAFNTCTWAWGLDNLHDYTAGIAQAGRANPQVQQAMVNLLTDLGVPVPTPMAGVTVPAPVSLNTYAENPDPEIPEEPVTTMHVSVGGEWVQLDSAEDVVSFATGGQWLPVPLAGGDGGGDTAEPARVGSTVAELNAAGVPSDGQLGILRLGTWPNQHEEYLRWVAGSPGRWVSEERIIVTQNDSWAMDLGNRSAADLVQFTRIMQAIPYGKAYAQVVGAQNVSGFAGAGVLTVNDTRDGTTAGFGKSLGFQNSGTLLVRDNIITYTGRTNTTFTGCNKVAGTGGVIPATVDVLQGYTGGYGFVIAPVPWAEELWAAGLRLQEKALCLMNDAPGATHQLEVAPYWREFDNGDGNTLSDYAVGGLGMSAVLRQAVAADGGNKNNERMFHWTENGWTDWTEGVPSKRYLTPTIMGKMDAGAIDTGEVLDYRLAVRWRS